MKNPLLFILFPLLLIQQVFGQVNVPLLHQLVADSESEYDKQTNARTRQAAVSANEQVNNNKLSDLKVTYRNIHNRFKTLGLVINVAQIGYEAAPVINEIVSQQSKIFEIAGRRPLLIPLAAGVEADLAGQAQALINYCYGLVLSIGDVNQMKASDRKLLFSFVVTELRRINGTSRGLLASMKSYENQLTGRLANPFAGFIDQDKRLIDDIIRNANAF